MSQLFLSNTATIYKAGNDIHDVTFQQYAYIYLLIWFPIASLGLYRVSKYFALGKASSSLNILKYKNLQSLLRNWKPKFIFIRTLLLIVIWANLVGSTLQPQTTKGQFFLGHPASALQSFLVTVWGRGRGRCRGWATQWPSPCQVASSGLIMDGSRAQW